MDTFPGFGTNSTGEGRKNGTKSSLVSVDFVASYLLSSGHLDENVPQIRDKFDWRRAQ